MIKAIPFMNIVRAYAQAKGMKFFTWKQMKNAITYYQQNTTIA